MLDCFRETAERVTSEHFEERHYRNGAAWRFTVDLSDTELDCEDGTVDE